MGTTQLRTTMGTPQAKPGGSATAKTTSGALGGTTPRPQRAGSAGARPVVRFARDPSKSINEPLVTEIVEGLGDIIKLFSLTGEKILVYLDSNPRIATDARKVRQEGDFMDAFNFIKDKMVPKIVFDNATLARTFGRLNEEGISEAEFKKALDKNPVLANKVRKMMENDEFDEAIEEMVDDIQGIVQSIVSSPMAVGMGSSFTRPGTSNVISVFAQSTRDWLSTQEGIDFLNSNRSVAKDVVNFLRGTTFKGEYLNFTDNLSEYVPALKSDMRLQIDRILKEEAAKKKISTLPPKEPEKKEGLFGWLKKTVAGIGKITNKEMAERLIGITHLYGEFKFSEIEKVLNQNPKVAEQVRELISTGNFKKTQVLILPHVPRLERMFKEGSAFIHPLLKDLEITDSNDSITFFQSSRGKNFLASEAGANVKKYMKSKGRSVEVSSATASSVPSSGSELSILEELKRLRTEFIDIKEGGNTLLGGGSLIDHEKLKYDGHIHDIARKLALLNKDITFGTFSRALDANKELTKKVSDLLNSEGKDKEALQMVEDEINKTTTG